MTKKNPPRTKIIVLTNYSENIQKTVLISVAKIIEVK